MTPPSIRQGPCVVCRRSILYKSDETTILCDDCADRVIERLRCVYGCAAVPLGMACWCRPEEQARVNPSLPAMLRLRAEYMARIANLEGTLFQTTLADLKEDLACLDATIAEMPRPEGRKERTP